ncbi:MAG: APC family permease [Mycoplasma sp.]
MTNQKRFAKESTPNPLSKAKGPKITMKTENANKIGLFGAISIIVGAIIGVGIFFKNGGVFKNNNGNAWGVLISWIVVFIIAFSTAFSYAEVSKAKTKTEGSGLAGWIERYIGYRTGRFVKLVYPMFYYTIYVVAMFTFAAEAFLNIIPQIGTGGTHMIDGAKVPFVYVLLIGAGMAAFFIIMNMISDSVGTKMSGVLSLIKFLPITLVVVAGIAAAVVNHGGNDIFINPGQVFPDGGETGDFNFIGILTSLPAIMFAFDSFLIVGSVSNQVKNPTKTVPLSIILSMSLCGILYAFIVISQIISGCGSPYLVFDAWFGAGSVGANVGAIIIAILLFLSLIGVCNSVIIAGTRACQAAINEEIIVGYQWFKKISNGKKSSLFGGAILCAIFSFAWFVIGGIPSIVLNTDQVIDGLSNLVVVFFFFIYGVVPMFSLKWWCKVPESEVKHTRGQVVPATIGCIGCVFVAIYSMFYTFGADIIMHPNDSFSPWGLFYFNWSGIAGVQAQAILIPKWGAALVFWGTALLFFVLPFANDWMLKLTNKKYNQKLLWQR